MTHGDGHSEQTTGGGDVGHSGADSGRTHHPARKPQGYEPMCACGGHKSHCTGTR